MKLVINSCFGGFSLSWAAVERLKELGHPEALAEERNPDPNWARFDSYLREIARNDPLFLQVVEELGEKASGRCARLEVVEVNPSDPWFLHEYDGNEHIETFDPRERGLRLVGDKR